MNPFNAVLVSLFLSFFSALGQSTTASSFENLCKLAVESTGASPDLVLATRKLRRIVLHGKSYEEDEQRLNTLLGEFIPSLAPQEFSDIAVDLIKNRIRGYGAFYRGEPIFLQNESRILQVFDVIRVHSLKVNLELTQIEEIQEAMLARAKRFRLFVFGWGGGALSELYALVNGSPFGASHHVGRVNLEFAGGEFTDPVTDFKRRWRSEGPGQKTFSNSNLRLDELLDAFARSFSADQFTRVAVYVISAGTMYVGGRGGISPEYVIEAIRIVQRHSTSFELTNDQRWQLHRAIVRRPRNWREIFATGFGAALHDDWREYRRDLVVILAGPFGKPK